MWRRKGRMFENHHCSGNEGETGNLTLPQVLEKSRFFFTIIGSDKEGEPPFSNQKNKLFILG